MYAQLPQSNISSPRQIRSYAELKEQLRRDLAAQNPAWVDSHGNSPMLDSYDRRLAELISFFQAANQKSVAA